MICEVFVLAPTDLVHDSEFSNGGVVDPRGPQ
jgi:hypothetical protein